LKNQVPPIVIVAVVVVLVVLIGGVYALFERPKGLPNPKAAVVQGLGKELPRQPFIPTADGGKASTPAAMGAAQGRPPVAQGAGGIPQQTIIPGSH
jgi:hypothetical protein